MFANTRENAEPAPSTLIEANEAVAVAIAIICAADTPARAPSGEIAWEYFRTSGSVAIETLPRRRIAEPNCSYASDPRYTSSPLVYWKIREIGRASCRARVETTGRAG